MRSSSAGYKKRTRYLFTSTAFLFFFSVAFSQRTVTGRVTDQDSKPLPTATVTVKGTNVSTATNADGQYSIVLPANSNTLVFSYVG